MNNSIFKAALLAVAFAAPTTAFATSYGDATPGVTLVSTKEAASNPSEKARQTRPGAGRTEKSYEERDRGGTRPAGPMDNEYTHWDSNTNAG